ncbi:MAG TPA: hypothetical protein VIV14_05845 [Gammaproteobacteria bacterium]
MARLGFRVGKEIFIGLILLGFGFFALPAIVYSVGIRIVGDYGAEGGVDTLMSHVRSDLAAGNIFAWLLVLSPYVIVQLLRLARYLWRAKPGVTEVTVSD